MSNKQGLETIVEAARELEYSDPKVKFVLCGEGPHKERLQTLAAGLKIPKFMNFQTPSVSLSYYWLRIFILFLKRLKLRTLFYLQSLVASSRPVDL